MEGDIPASFIAGVGDNGKVRRAYFHPLRVACETPMRPQNNASQREAQFEESHDCPRETVRWYRIMGRCESLFYEGNGQPSNTREATYTATVNDVSVRVTGR